MSTISLSVNADSPRYKIGMALWTGYPENVRGFKDGLAEKGIDIDNQVEFVEGVISSDKAIQKRAAEKIKESNVDLVYSLTTPGTVIIKETLPESTPIVFSIVTYPADSGLIESFEYSANNLVGTSNYVPLQHYVALISELAPNTKSVAIFHRKGEPNSNIQTTNLIRLLKRKNIMALNIEAVDINDLTEQANQVAGQVDLFITTTDTLLQNGGETALIKISLENKVPILSSNKAGILSGSTFGPVADLYVLGKMSGHKAAEILLNGTRPSHIESDLQEQPTFLINSQSASLLGLEIDKNSSDKYQWYENE
ncbi:ABC transporter substrate-binding protein [Vibrio lamellibrachiae]|uniref:ABC transporter substrate-binding protein n=1 Tax=Vibrio lamellibrachiae TaxID=2910253 RepID=UPI003D098094